MGWGKGEDGGAPPPPWCMGGGLGAALRLWRASVSKEFEGVEECLICYSVVLASAAAAGGSGGNSGAGALPRRACKTCGKKFHGACLYKWFRSSARAASCPHCQSDWS